MQNDDQNNKLELLSIGDASEYLGISIDTLRRWEKKGRIEPLRSPGGHRYYSKKALEDLFGKRYTRDEETHRTSGQLITPDNLSNVVDSSALPDKSEIIEDVQIPPREQLSPVGLPAWRTIRQTESVQNTEITMGISENNVPSVERQSREIKIPQIPLISIVATKTEKTISASLPQNSQEAYFNQQKESILTPVAYKGDTNKVENNAVSNNKTDIVTSQTPKVSDDSLKSSQGTKKMVAVFLFIVGAIVLSMTWYSLWQKSQIILSPIP